MKVLIVSDTHGRHAGIEEAIEREYPFQKLIHLGDAEGYEEYIAELAECPIEIVAGNNDFFSDLPDEKIIFIEDFCALITHGHAYGVSMGYQNIRNEGRVRGVDAVMFGHPARPPKTRTRHRRNVKRRLCAAACARSACHASRGPAQAGSSVAAWSYRNPSVRK